MWLKPSSVQGRVSLALAVAIVSVTVLSSGAAFVGSYLEARGLQDDALRQIATLSHPVTSRESETRIITIGPEEARPAWIPVSLEPGFHTVEAFGEPMRIYVHDASPRGRVYVAQAAEVSEDAAFASALRTAVPLLILFPLLAWLLGRVLAAERASFERQARFLANAAHELRTPLAVLSIQSENLANAPDEETLRGRVPAIQNGIRRTRHLAMQLLDYARGDGPSEALVRSDLTAVIREVMRDLIPAAAERDIELVYEGPASLLVLASPQALQAILRNGIDNAIKYSPCEGLVEVKLSTLGDEALIEVNDRGPGIPEAALDRAFEPFTRFDTEAGGSGLGLTIARAAATRNRGTVSVRNREHGGLTFQYRQRRIA